MPRPPRSSPRACWASWSWWSRSSGPRAGAPPFMPRRPRSRCRCSACAARARLACALPVLMGFLLPAAILVGLAATSPEARAEARLVALVGNSFTLSGVTALAAVLLAVALAYAARLSKSRVAAAANRVAALGYAVPGAVIAVGVLVPLGRLGNWLP